MNKSNAMGDFLSTLPARLDHIIQNQAATRPDAPCLRQDDRLMSYAALARAVDAAARWLEELGVRPGDRVMLVNENSITPVALLFALSRLDAWAVLVNARIADGDVDLIRDHCRPRRIIYTHEVSPEAAAHGRRHNATGHDLDDLGPVLVSPLLDAEAEPVYADNAQQVAVMIYTTGTTGAPKGVMLTHRNLLYSAVMSSRARALRADDRVYAVLPMAHIFGLTSTLLTTLTVGGCAELVPRFDPAHLAASLARDISVFQGVPAMYAGLLEHGGGDGGEVQSPHLRFLSVGGAPMDVDLRRRVEATLGVTLCNGYGMTETSPTVSINRPDQPHGDDSVGIPLEGQELRMVDRQGHDVPAGEVGELWVRGPNIMKGYYRNPEATAAVLNEEGWLNTGDLARLSANGALYIVGRSKELIIRSGFNVYPPEVEAALNSHPDVVQSAVVGRAVPGNEEVVAFVQPVPGSPVSEEVLKAFMRDKVTAYKRPARIILMDVMPAAPTGKPLKNKLSERLQAGEFDESNANAD